MSLPMCNILYGRFYSTCTVLTFNSPSVRVKHHNNQQHIQYCKRLAGFGA